MSIAQMTYRMDVLIACLFVLGILGVASDYVFLRTARLVFPWIGKTSSA